jgi:hypothetical protein
VRDTGVESLLNANEPQPVVFYQNVGLAEWIVGHSYKAQIDPAVNDDLVIGPKRRFGK